MRWERPREASRTAESLARLVSLPDARLAESLADAAADDRTKCAAESEAYDKACMKSWRRYFDDRRKHGKAQLAVARFETDGSK